MAAHPNISVASIEDMLNSKNSVIFFALTFLGNGVVSIGHSEVLFTSFLHTHVNISTQMCKTTTLNYGILNPASTI